jgi:hypothetical protein
MAHNEYDAKALLALPSIKEGVAEETGLTSWSRPYLIAQIRKNGVDVNVVRGAVSLDGDEGWARDAIRPSYDLEGSVTLLQLGDVSLAEYGVVRTIVRAVDVREVPVLNPNSVRTLARNKFEMASEILIPSDAYGRQIAFFDPLAPKVNVNDAFRSIVGDQFVAKPNSGRLSRGVLVGSKKKVAGQLKKVSVPYIIEERLDFSAPLPDIRGLGEAEQARLDEANKLGVNKELRTFYFGNGVWDGAGRISRPGEVDFHDDKWLQIELDSIPSELIDMGNAIVEKIRQRIGTDEINIAIDWVFASSASEPTPSWRVMELNGAEPQLVQVKQHEEVGKRQHSKLAIQISRIALN